jgi:hypothetical protein
MGGFQMGGLVLFWLIALIDRAVRTRREDGERVVWQARGHDVVYLCAGCLVIVGSVLLWLLWNGAMGDWYRQSIVFPLKGYIVFVCQKSVLWAWYDNGVQLALADLRTKWFWPMWGIAIILCGIRAIADRNLLLVCLAAVSLASWFNVLPVPCDGHQWWAFTPGFCFLPLLIWDFLKLERAVYRLLATTAVLLFVLGGPIYKGCVIGWERLSTCTVPISPVPAGPNYPPALTGMLDNEQRAKAYVELIQSIGDYLDRHPGKQLAILGETGAVFLPPDRNYHPLFVEWIYITTNIYANYHSMKRAWLQQNRPLLFTTSLQLEIHKQRYNCDLKELEHYAAVKVLPIPCIAERWDYVLLAPVEEK